jgi:hypothetical protein
MINNIYQYIKSGVEELPNQIYGPGYRCSATLSDGTFLPCVMLLNAGPTVKLAIRRFEEEKKGTGAFRSAAGYNRIVETFVTAGNKLNSYDVKSVEPSRYAIPLELLQKLRGETTMSWTGFVLEMNDGKMFSFGTTFGTEFFNLPDSYSFDDVIELHNHSYVSSQGELRSLRQGYLDAPGDYRSDSVFRERPYFTCYYDRT